MGTPVVPARQRRREVSPSTHDAEYRAHVAQLVTQRRLARGLRQEALAALVGISRHGISGQERGLYWLHTATLLHVAEVLDLQPWHLFPPLVGTPAAELIVRVQTLSEAEQWAWLQLLNAGKA